MIRSPAIRLPLDRSLPGGPLVAAFLPPLAVIAAVLAPLALAAPAAGQPSAKPKPADRPADKPRVAAAPVIACPSVANYRMLMHDGAPAAAATLADPKADHLGCAALPRNRIGGIVDRVSLGGRSYDCAAVKDTTVCHWVETGTLPASGEAGWR